MIPLGPRLRSARKKKGITQSKLAKSIGISVSYLNLIEHNKRNVGPALVAKLSRALDIDLDTLSAPQDARLIQDLENLAADPLFRSAQLEHDAPKNIVGNHPHWAKAILKLQQSHQASNEAIEAMSERLARDPYMVESSHQILNIITGIRSFSEILADAPDLPEDIRASMTAGLSAESQKLGTAAQSLFEFINAPGNSPRQPLPGEQINDFLIDNNNYFAELEEAASDLRSRIGNTDQRLNEEIRGFLKQHHGIVVKFQSPKAANNPGIPPQYDHGEKGNELNIDNTLPEASVRFLLANCLFEREYDKLVHTLIERAALPQEALIGARRALLNYAAAALLFPYEPFLKACQQTRYDIETLQRRFGASFEQVCHRLTTLRRPGASGIAFAFLRVDPAGNISKRFSLPNLPLPRGGGACPLLLAYRAFFTPGQINTQIGLHPEGEKYLYIARTLAKPAQDFHHPPRLYAIMIACEIHRLDEIVYGDRLIGQETQYCTPIGNHCRTCSRTTCQHRAHASVLHLGTTPDIID